MRWPPPPTEMREILAYRAALNLMWTVVLVCAVLAAGWLHPYAGKESPTVSPRVKPPVRITD